MLERFGNKRIPLFRFQIQDTVWRFAQADRDIDAGGFPWLAAPGIDRDAIRRNNERAQQNLKIRLPYLRDPDAPLELIPPTQDIGDLWHPYAPSSPVQVTCLSTDAAGSTPVYEWGGVVGQPKYTEIELELTCTPGNTRLQARNQGAKFQRACWKVAYSTGIRGCNLDPDEFLIPATLTDVDGLTLTAAEFATAPHSLLQGWFTWTRSNGRVERRPIVYHSGSVIRLLWGGLELADGLECSVLPNCPGNWAACAARRADPQNHYGGAMYEPVKNPMQGVSMSWGG